MIRRLEFEVSRCRKTIRNQELSQKSIQNEITGLENELIASQSIIDQLKLENQHLVNREKKSNDDMQEEKAKCELLEKRYNALVKCKKFQKKTKEIKSFQVFHQFK